jgi:hypothetical protein
MPKLSTVARDEALVRVPFGDEAVTVFYRPSQVTGNLIEALEGGANLAALFEPLSRLLARWDLLDDDTNEEVPTTVDGLKRVPLDVLIRVAEAVAQHVGARPNGPVAVGP